MEKRGSSYYAIAGPGSDIYTVGGYHRTSNDSLDNLDTASLLWESGRIPLNIPKKKINAAAVLLKDRYLVMIGGLDDDFVVTADCLVYDIWSRNWSVTPPSIDMLTPRVNNFTVAVLDGKIIVAGGSDGDTRLIVTPECIDIDDVLEFAPLHYPLPLLVFDRILEIGKANDDRGDTGEAPRKKAKIIQSNC